MLTISSGFGRILGILVLLNVYIDILLGGPLQWGWISVDDLRGLQSREDIWRRTKTLRAHLHETIKANLQESISLQLATGIWLSPELVDKIPKEFRLRRNDMGEPTFSVSALREARRLRDDGTVLNQVFITLVQVALLGEEDHPTKIRSGCTLVVDLGKLPTDEMQSELKKWHPDENDQSPVMYVIRKNLLNGKRLDRISEFIGERRRSLLATYFKASDEPFAALHDIGA